VAKTEALGQASQKLGEKVYADAQAQAGAAGGAGAEGGKGKSEDADVVDAEFTEVQDDKK